MLLDVCFFFFSYEQKKVFVSTEVAWQLKSPGTFALSCAPWLISPQVCRKHMQLFTQPYSVFFSIHSIYIIHLHLQNSASQKDRPIYLCWSTCTRDFILISSWRSSQTDGRGQDEFIISISLSLSPTHTYAHNVKTWCIGCICIKITLFCVAIILAS